MNGSCWVCRERGWVPPPPETRVCSSGVASASKELAHRLQQGGCTRALQLSPPGESFCVPLLQELRISLVVVAEHQLCCFWVVLDCLESRTSGEKVQQGAGDPRCKIKVAGEISAAQLDWGLFGGRSRLLEL